MKKIPSVFKRDYEGTRQVYDEVVEGSEWVLAGEGTPTVKVDGTACMIRDDKLYKRFDRKRGKNGKPKPAPPEWEPCEPEPNQHTGHWPGWLPVTVYAPEDRWHREAMRPGLADGTYELIGPKVQGNPYKLLSHLLVRHGSNTIESDQGDLDSFEAIRSFLEAEDWIEGIVWHHPDGRMAKIKRKDFGLLWPVGLTSGGER